MEQPKHQLCLDVDAGRKDDDVQAAAIGAEGSDPAARVAKGRSSRFGLSSVVAGELPPTAPGNEERNGAIETHYKQGDTSRGLERIKLHLNVVYLSMTTSSTRRARTSHFHVLRYGRGDARRPRESVGSTLPSRQRNPVIPPKLPPVYREDPTRSHRIPLHYFSRHNIQHPTSNAQHPTPNIQ